MVRSAQHDVSTRPSATKSAERKSVAMRRCGDVGRKELRADRAETLTV